MLTLDIILGLAGKLFLMMCPHFFSLIWEDCYFNYCFIVSTLFSNLIKSRYNRGKDLKPKCAMICLKSFSLILRIISLTYIFICTYVGFFPLIERSILLYPPSNKSQFSLSKTIILPLLMFADYAQSLALTCTEAVEDYGFVYCLH